MRLNGHKTPSIFERCNIVSDGDLRSAADKLSWLAGTKKGQSRAIAVNDDSEVEDSLCPSRDIGNTVFRRHR